MKPSSANAPRFAARSLVTALLSIGLASLATAQTTTMGTRGSNSSTNTALTTNAGSTWSEYTRAEQYPKITTLPLQFITMKNGKKLAVFVSMPADADGNPVAGNFPAVLTQTAYRIDTEIGRAHV